MGSGKVQQYLDIDYIHHHEIAHLPPVGTHIHGHGMCPVQQKIIHHQETSNIAVGGCH
jgi:hypothetical protein